MVHEITVWMKKEPRGFVARVCVPFDGANKVGSDATRSGDIHFGQRHRHQIVR